MNSKGFIVLCISAFIIAVGIGIIVPVLPLYAEDLGASGLLLGIIYASFAASMAICNPVMGRLSDRIGKKVMITAGFGLGVFMAAAYAVATGPAFLIVVRIFNGVIAAMVMPTIMAYIGELSPEGQEGTYMGVYGMMLLFGGATGPVVGGRIADVGGMDVVFYAFAVSMGLCFILTLFFLPAERVKEACKGSSYPIRDLLASMPLKGLFIFSFVLAIAQSGLMVFMPLLARNIQLTTTQVGILVSGFAFFSGAFQVPFGGLANRYNRVHLVLAGTILLGVGLAFLPQATGILSMLFICSFLGLFSAVASPAANAMLVEHSRQIGVGTAAGLMNTSGNLGMIIGPISAGIIMDQINLASAFHTYAAIFILGAGVFYYFTRGIPRSTGEEDG